MAKTNKQVQIYPQLKEIEVERLAAALVSLIEHLPPRDRTFFVTEGEKVRNGLGQQPKQKGSAA